MVKIQQLASDTTKCSVCRPNSFTKTNKKTMAMHLIQYSCSFAQISLSAYTIRQAVFHSNMEPFIS